jgi:DNA-directed RNA polymerase specialized sigma24 family protein
MSSPGSITQLLNQLKARERTNVQKLWERYFHRMVGLARKRLQRLPRHISDEEDVALSAFKSFCLAAENGRFPQLADSDDLWQILVMLVQRKAANVYQYETRARRDCRRVQRQAVDDAAEGADFVQRLRSKEPDPQFVVEVTEVCALLLERLSDEKLRQVALRKMEGYTNNEIAATMDCAEVTIERRLNLIRRTWDREGEKILRG